MGLIIHKTLNYFFMIFVQDNNGRHRSIAGQLKTRKASLSALMVMAAYMFIPFWT